LCADIKLHRSILARFFAKPQVNRHIGTFPRFINRLASPKVIGG
jgi:hypothetical protein